MTFHRVYLLVYFRFGGPQLIGIVFTVVSYTCDESSSSLAVNVKPLVNVGYSPILKTKSKYESQINELPKSFLFGAFEPFRGDL